MSSIRRDGSTGFQWLQETSSETLLYHACILQLVTTLYNYDSVLNISIEGKDSNAWFSDTLGTGNLCLWIGKNIPLHS